MSFPRYPKYKDSGVEWLGQVPEHWEVKQLGYICSKIGSGKTPSGGAEIYTDEGIVFLRSQNIYDEGLFLDDVVYITEEIDEDLRASRVLAGDILLNITGASLGRTCLAPKGLPQANVNQHVCIIRLKDLASREYVAQSMKSCWVKGQIANAQTGAAREGLNFAQISRLALTLPPLFEQKSIADFLDRETAKIDELVAEQQRLMELLKEKRQAVISHAVTKGLNPNATMKPSGIEWLGDVPAHWTVKMLRFVAKLNPPKSEIGRLSRDTVVSFLPMDAIGEDGTIRLEAEKILSEVETGYTYFRDGDVVVAKITPCFENGKGALMNGLRNGIGFGTTELIVARPNPDAVAGSFLHYLFISSVFRKLGEAEMYGAGGQKRVPDSFVRNFTTGIPPLGEQVSIVEFLDEEIAKFDTLTAEAQRAIDLLQERRTALISAAVTGQIDVRTAN